MKRKIERLAAHALSLPVLLLFALVAPLVMLLALPPLALMVFRKNRFSIDSDDDVQKNVNEDKNDHTMHAIITGGSSGIGLSIAKECVTSGFDRVTIIARNQDKLNNAKALLEKESSSQKVEVVSVDVTDAAAVQEAASKICEKGNSRNNCSTYLFLCAGEATPGHFGKLSPDAFAKQSRLNYLGAVHTVHAFLPYMKRGTIVLTLSAAGQVGIYGYTAYSGPKFALKGFAESLHMELLCKDVNVQLSFPPDTDTPGYQIEQQSKPKACNMISQTLGLVKPEDVARVMVREATRTNPKYVVYFGLEGWMLSTLTAGMCPESSLLDVLCQVALMGLYRFVSFFYLNDFWDVCSECDAEAHHTQTNNYQSIS